MRSMQNHPSPLPPNPDVVSVGSPLPPGPAIVTVGSPLPPDPVVFAGA